jgi:signal transduction histidine kinase/chromosome segregation and condensation protein ScpB
MSLATPKAYNSIEEKNYEYITTPDILASLAAKMGYSLNSVVTIVWNGGENEVCSSRTDEYGTSHEMRPSCRLYRRYFKDLTEKKPLCDCVDNYYIEYLKYRLGKRETTPKKPWCCNNEYLNELNFVESDTEFVGHLEYRCPIMGYREILFPIIIEDHFLGAIFIGQIIQSIDKKGVFGKNYHADFENFITNDPIYQVGLDSGIINDDRLKDIKKVRDIESNVAIKQLNSEKADNNQTEELLYFLTEGFQAYTKVEYEDFIEKCKRHVKELTDDINKILSENRQKYIHMNIKDIRKYADSRGNELNNSENYKHLTMTEKTQEYENTLTGISERLMDFGVNSIRIFGFQRVPGILSDKMELVFSTEKGETKDEQNVHGEETLKNKAKEIRKKRPRFNYKKLPDSNKPQHPWRAVYCNNQDSNRHNDQEVDIKYKRIYSNIKQQLDFSDLKSIVSSDDLMFVLYQGWLVVVQVGNLEQNRNIYNILLEEITSLFTSFLSRYSLLLSSFLIDKYILTLRLYRHECAHIALAINSRVKNDLRHAIELIKEYKSSKIPYPVSQIQDRNLEAACGDIEADVSLIMHMADTIGILTGRITRDNLNKLEHKREFRIVNDVIIKWEKAISLDYRMREKNMRIMYEDNLRDQTITERYRLIDLMVYNLIDNAVKYGYWGTRVNITIGTPETTKSWAFPLTIENYGYSIAESPKAYEMYYRGMPGEETSNILKEENGGEDDHDHVEGDGLGLYIVKTISDMLDLYINYRCEYISDYNVGLIDAYIERGSDNSLKETLKVEKALLGTRFSYMTNHIKQESISTTDISKAMLEEDIYLKTNRVTFELSLMTRSNI